MESQSIKIEPIPEANNDGHDDDDDDDYNTPTKDKNIYHLSMSFPIVWGLKYY